LKNTTIYQTLQDKENPDEVETNGPYLCNWDNSWLGDGYYFWDTFIENAHWWGETHCRDCYMICEALVDLDDTNCFDLVGNTNHLKDFGDSIEFMQKQGLISENTTVSRVLEFMKENNLFLNFSAIRAYGINSKGKRYEPNYRLIFEIGKSFQYLPYKPEIQLCIIRFENLNFRDFKIVYPDYYNPEYAV
jgi:hypothetical protein